MTDKKKDQPLSGKTEHKALSVELKDETEGVVTARFARLGVKDKDGDLTEPGAFGDQPVKVSAFGHGSWMGELPVGVGTISEKDDEAIADLQFFMNTTHGRDHFETVKGLGDLGEWSYAFDVLEEAAPDEAQRELGIGRILKKLKVHEVSPVLQGAGIDTQTMSVKSECSECGGGMKEEKGDTLGTLLRQLRDDADLSNEDLAGAMGVDESTVGQILDGSINCPPLDRLRGAADRLGVPLSRLLTAARRDGCDYEEDETRSAAISESVMREVGRYEAIKHAAGDLLK